MTLIGKTKYYRGLTRMNADQRGSEEIAGIAVIAGIAAIGKAKTYR
jgi:hypothetical protein